MANAAKPTVPGSAVASYPKTPSLRRAGWMGWSDPPFFLLRLLNNRRVLAARGPPTRSHGDGQAHSDKKHEHQHYEEPIWHMVTSKRLHTREGSD